MRITLYNSNAEKQRVNKGSYLSKIIEMDGTLRNECSVSNPSIMINLDPYDIEQGILKNVYVVDNNRRNVIDDNSHKIIYDIISEVLTCNYVHIREFDRYYYVQDITSYRNNLWILNLKCDPLMSFMGEIKNLNAFVTRNEFTYNDLIKDDIVSYYYNRDVSEYVPVKGDKVNKTFTAGLHARNFVLTCISFNTIPSGWDISSPDDGLPNINPLYYTEQFGSTSYLLASYQAEYVTYRALKSSSLQSYVKSLIAMPFDPTPNVTDPTQYPIVYLGDTAIKNLQDVELTAPYNKYKISDYIVIADFTIPSTGSFMDYQPYTMYELYIPYSGWITLDPDQVLDKRLIVYYSVNYEDGSANVYVYDTTGNKLIYTGTCQIGVKIPISTTNNEELTAQRNANNLNLTLGLISSVASVGIGASTGNATAVVGGVLSGTKTIGSYINNNSMMFDRAQATYSSGVSGLYTPQDVIVRKTKLIPKDYDSDFLSLHGKPLNEYVKLGDLTGYTEVGNVHLEGFKTANNQDLTEIEALLKQGIIL